MAAATDVGRVRKHNEDSFLLEAPLFVVADGMGGANAGEVASGLAIEAFKEPLDQSLAPEPRMADAVKRANHSIWAKSITDDAFQGMGTTITSLLLGGDELTIAHVGDSRAYRLRGGELTRLTIDHSLVGEMVRKGAITEAEAEVHPQRSILTRALGPEDSVEIDTLSYQLREGDVYLLCSDGLTGMVSEAEIAKEMGSGEPMQKVADNLIRRANENGGVDNITVVAFRLDGEANAAAANDSGDTIVAPAVAGSMLVPEPPSTESPKPAPPIPQTAAGGGEGSTTPSKGSVSEYERRRQQSAGPRRKVGLVITTAVVLMMIAGAIVGSLNVYFLGGNEKGLVTVYRGLPYDLPLSVSLYTRDYVTSVPVSELPDDLRQKILDHKLRSRSDALDLASQVEQGDVDPAYVDGPQAKDQVTGATGN
jgi:protein phosphatase